MKERSSHQELVFLCTFVKPCLISSLLLFSYSNLISSFMQLLLCNVKGQSWVHLLY